MLDRCSWYSRCLMWNGGLLMFLMNRMLLLMCGKYGVLSRLYSMVRLLF